VETIDVIILAGGLGTRLREVVGNTPKVLASVNNRPFLDIVLGYLDKWECVGKVVIAAGYMAERIITEYDRKNRYHFQIDFSVEKELLGTGGGIIKGLGFTTTDIVLALNGDSYINVDLTRLSATHNARKAAMTIVVRRVGDAGRYGSVKLDSYHKIISFHEKKSGQTDGYINAGVYLFRRRLFEAVDAGKVLSLERELLPYFLEKEEIYGYVSTGKFIDIGTPESYRIADSYLKEMI